MRVENHGSHLIQLTRLKAVNAYLVREDDGFTLVDTGIPGGAAGYLAAARDAGGEIRRIVLTHGHSDHAGSLEALAGKLPGVEVLFGAREARFLRGDKGMEPGEPDAKPKGMVKLDRRPERELAPGDRVGSLEVVAAPGHTPGQIALLDMRDRTLIAADAFATLGGTSVSSEITFPFPFPGVATWHRPTALATGHALRALDPARLAVGHGRVLAAPAAEMDRALAAAG